MCGQFEKCSAGLERITADQFDDLERWMMAQPEIEIPVTHEFSGGLYIRQGFLPAGSLVLGHEHKAAHHCVVLKGRMTLLTPDGEVSEIIAPCAFIGQPGRKLVFVREEVLMQNIHPTGAWPQECHGNIEAMEEHLYRRSKFYKSHRLQKAACQEIAA